MNVLDAFKDHLLIEKNYAENTVLNYLRDVKDFSDFIIREELASDLLGVKRERLGRHYLSYLESKGYARKSVARKISSLRTFYGFLVKENHIDINIFETLETPKIPKKLPELIQDDEIDHLR